METTEKHPGGRPPIYDEENESDILKVKELCEDYFTTVNTSDNEKPPTVTGLTLHLGFADKSSLYDYAKKPKFSHSIKRALTGIEQFHEESIAEGDKCTGNIFALKNMGWHDTVKTDVTTGGEKINSNSIVQVEIVKPNDE